MKKLTATIICCLLFTFFIYNVHTVNAADFAFDYDVSYNVQSTGKTSIKQNITLTNLTTQYYAQNFTLVVNSTKLTDISARDPGGEVIPQVTSSDGQTVISVPFNIKEVGINKSFMFNLDYSSRDIATKKGRIWEIIIPGIEKKEDLRSYKIRLQVPESWGTPAYVSPQPNSDGFWDLTQLPTKGIAAAYGDYQQFSFNLIYNLENTSLKDELQEITLPPTTAFQEVIINRLSEIPLKVDLDKNGNWLATYKIKKNDSKRIVAEGSVQIYIKPQSGFSKKLTPYEREIYTSIQPYWERNDEITRLANELKTPKAIYDYVTEFLTYDYSRIRPGIERLGAKSALASPGSAMCMEFSDLFVALARAAGIPTREIHGFAYTTNSRLQPLSLVSDVLHAWPEYYDEDRELWVPVDPTWANTTLGVDYFSKLDFNHVAFAILGDKSDYPYPAGTFKTQDSGKNVFIDFDNNENILPKTEYLISFDIAKVSLAGLPLHGKLTVTNTGQRLINLEQFKFSAGLPITFDKNSLKNIPPFAKLDVPFILTPALSFSTSNYFLSLILNGKEHTDLVKTYPTYLLLLPVISLMFIAVVAFVILKRHGRKKIH